MDKQDMYKIFAIGLVAVFMIEGIAIGLMSSNRSGNGGTGQEANVGSGSLEGTASTNVTVVRYEPYLIVRGSGPAVEAALQKLVDSGIATYSVKSGSDLIVNLKSSALAPDAASALEAANATVYANAVVATAARVRVEGSGVSTTVEGASFTMQMRPLYDEGATVGATFAAQASGGKLASIGSFSFLPSFVQNATVVAQLVSSSNENYLEVPWEARAAARAIARNESNAAFKERSFILVQQNASGQQLNAALAAGSDYVTGVQAGLVSVKNDFVDRKKAEEDLRAAGLEPEFPPSLITFSDANSSEEMADAMVVKMLESGYLPQVRARKTATVRLPEEIVHGGKAYQTGGLEFGFEQSSDIGPEGARLEIGFEAAGNRLVRLTSIRQLPAPSQNASNATAGG